VLLVLAACAGQGAADESDGPPQLSWYTGPDRVDAEALARACTTEAAGEYTISVQELPEDVDERHALLVRRLAADDDSMDLITLDNAFTTEFSAARFLNPVPEDLKIPLAQDVFPSALLAASDGERLVVAPWWFDPYLLWWRGNTAERAGLDTTEPITWQALLDGAERLDARIEVEDLLGNGLPALVNALVVGDGGTMLQGRGRDPELGLDTPAGASAAEIVRRIGGRGEPGPSPDAAQRFAARSGSFLIAPSSVVSDPALGAVGRDLRWTSFPMVDAESIAPPDGAGLAVPLFARHSALSWDAISCLTSDASMREIMTGSGHSAARASLYEDEDVVAGYPLADVTEPAVRSGVAVPVTPYWSRVREALVDTWTPAQDVDPTTTPQRSERAVADAVAGRLP
jgi:multiple sugar transport system substrate-binding protein